MYQDDMEQLDYDTHSLELMNVARALVAPGKGILAADESSGTIAKRFAAAKINCTEENRMKYRKLLFATEGW
jgi:fructose-bisphosphate aldolase class I